MTLDSTSQKVVEALKAQLLAVGEDLAGFSLEGIENALRDVKQALLEAKAADFKTTAPALTDMLKDLCQASSLKASVTAYIQWRIQSELETSTAKAKDIAPKEKIRLPLLFVCAEVLQHFAAHMPTREHNAVLLRSLKSLLTSFCEREMDLGRWLDQQTAFCGKILALQYC